MSLFRLQKKKDFKSIVFFFSSRTHENTQKYTHATTYLPFSREQTFRSVVDKINKIQVCRAGIEISVQNRKPKTVLKYQCTTSSSYTNVELSINCCYKST
jgi:hypothetical protein